MNKENSDNKYDDIINLEHHTSLRHPRMSSEARAAQFAPFAALTGYGSAVKETARITFSEKELDDNLINNIENKLQIIEEQLIKNEIVEISIIYFEKDIKKSGGQYESYTGKVKKIDKYNKKIIFINNKEIFLKDIINLDSEIFNVFYY